MTSDDEREVIAEVPLRNLTAEHERAMKAEQRATAAEAEVLRMRDAHSEALCAFAAERRLKDAAVGALRKLYGIFYTPLDYDADEKIDVSKCLRDDTGLDRATFDELGIAGDGTHE